MGGWLGDCFKEGWQEHMARHSELADKKSRDILKTSSLIRDLYRMGCSNKSLKTNQDCTLNAAKRLSETLHTESIVTEERERFFGENITDAINTFKSIFR